jgi:hypothetical protein
MNPIIQTLPLVLALMSGCAGLTVDRQGVSLLDHEGRALVKVDSRVVDRLQAQVEPAPKKARDGHALSARCQSTTPGHPPLSVDLAGDCEAGCVSDFSRLVTACLKVPDATLRPACVSTLSQVATACRAQCSRNP